MLSLYFDELEMTNLGSYVDLDIYEVDNKFKRCCFSFAACLLGFQHCRPIVMVDGTFLKGGIRASS